jgi:hypothetical protein
MFNNRMIFGEDGKIDRNMIMKENAITGDFMNVFFNPPIEEGKLEVIILEFQEDSLNETPTVSGIELDENTGNLTERKEKQEFYLEEGIFDDPFFTKLNLETKPKGKYYN